MKFQNKVLAVETKEKNIPFILQQDAVRGLICRIAGKKYAEKFVFSSIKPIDAGMDCYRISDRNDKILIEATSGVAAASAFRWYLEERCNSYVGPLTRRLAFPKNPPDVGISHAENGHCLYRYFLNYCTFGYTLAFWQWDRWENLIDWMMLSGYNLIFRPSFRTICV